MTHKTLFHTLLYSLFLTLLVACGGGSDSESETTPPPPTGGNPPPEVKPTPEEASLFLQQTTFGATTATIDDVVERGVEGWIDWQMSLPITKHKDYFNGRTIADDNRWNQHVSAWFHRSLLGQDQLRQRVAFALSEIWVISAYGLDGGNYRALSHYYDTLLTHSFGNYRDLMQAVTLNPQMGEYLSMLRNEKPNLEKNIRPDENFARELMQLFTIGLVELEIDGTPKRDSQGNTIPTYNQDIIEGFAHVFTGWTWGNAERFHWWSEQRDLEGPMQAFADYHAQGEKHLLNGYTIPAGLTPEEDLKLALDNIFDHPNLAPFVSKQLIQKLVTSNPSKDYVRRVSTVFNNNGQGIKGDLSAVIKAILLDDEARTGQTSADKIFGKVKEPILRLTALWRVFDGKASNGEYDFRWLNDVFSQGPLLSPSVFNFYSPSYSPQGEFQDNQWVAPEMEIHSEGTMAKMVNHLHWRIFSLNNLQTPSPAVNDIIININRERDLASEPEKLLEHLNVLLLAGKMSTELRQEILDLMATHNADRLKEKAVDAIAMIITSPEFSVQQ